MTENDYVRRIAELWPTGSGACASSEALELVEEALRAFPDSVRLWIDRGNLISLCDDDAPYELKDALRSYERAAVIAPDDPEPHDEIGHYHDAITDDPALAERHFQRAVELGGGPAASHYLARTMAEQGRRDEALEILLDPDVAATDDPDLQEIAEEIRAGFWDPD